jgi:hypothetical protein
VAIGVSTKLSRAYAELVRMGRIEALRATNAAIKQRHFARATGMLPPEPSAAARPRRRTLAALIVAAVCIGCALALMGQGGSRHCPHHAASLRLTSRLWRFSISRATSAADGLNELE